MPLQIFAGITSIATLATSSVDAATTSPAASAAGTPASLPEPIATADAAADAAAVAAAADPAAVRFCPALESLEPTARRAESRSPAPRAPMFTTGFHHLTTNSSGNRWLASTIKTTLSVPTSGRLRQFESRPATCTSTPSY
jgi:hypothetical protein